MRLHKRNILSSCNKAHLFLFGFVYVCICSGCGGVGGWRGGHKALFNSSIQASTFQMLIAVSSPSPLLLSTCLLPFLLKAQLPPTIRSLRKEWTRMPTTPATPPPTCIHHGVGGTPASPLSPPPFSVLFNIGAPSSERCPFEA